MRGAPEFVPVSRAKSKGYPISPGRERFGDFPFWGFGRNGFGEPVPFSGRIVVALNDFNLSCWSMEDVLHTERFKLRQPDFSSIF
jgi:hypothetical protein